MYALLMLLVTSVLISCSTSQDQTMSFETWSKHVQSAIEKSTPELSHCGQWLQMKSGEEVNIVAMIQVHPTGKIETLVLSESQRWGKPFYECVFNQLDQINLPQYSGEASVEIEQPLIYRKKENET
jgi:hypothetical protein